MENAPGKVNQGVRPLRAIAYARCSTDDQAVSGLGIEAQLHTCHHWAGREGRVIAAQHRDDGVSSVAELDHRPALMDAIAALQPGDVLVVAKRDRLARDPILAAILERDIKARGCRVVSAAGEGTATDDPHDILMRRMVDAFSEYERLLIGARTRAALAAKRRRGESTGQVPFGYDLAPDGKTLVPDPDALAARDWAVDCKAHGWSLRRIARELDRRGVRAKGGGPWRHSSVAGILRRHQAAEGAR